MDKNDGITVNCICAPCNNGWMSRLEDQAKPYIEVMMRGGKYALNEVNAPIVAAWIAKTAMMFEQVKTARERIYNALDRDCLRRHLRPPVNTLILLAHTVPGEYLLAAQSRNERIRGMRLVVGVLAIEVFVFPVQSASDATGMPNTMLHMQSMKTLVPLWPMPAEFVSWPPKARLPRIHPFA